MGEIDRELFCIIVKLNPVTAKQFPRRSVAAEAKTTQVCPCYGRGKYSSRHLEFWYKVTYNVFKRDGGTAKTKSDLWFFLTHDKMD